MPYIYGQLIAAQLENKTSDYANTITGAIWVRTDTDKVKIAKNSLVRDILVNDDKLTIGNNGTAGNNIRLHRGANTLLQFVVGGDVTAEGTLSTTLAQISAKFENYTTAARPAPGNPGRVIWNTDTAKLNTDNGVTWTDAGGSGSGGASGVESLAQKMEYEKYGLTTEDLDNSIASSGFPAELSRNYTATLLKDTASAVSSLEVVWNALSPNESDQNMDSATGWSATGSGASLATTSTAGEFQVGTAALKFDKSAGTTEAAIRYDIGSQTKQLNGNSRVWVYVKLPSITDLSNVLLRVYADTTSNFQTFTTSTDYAGNALAIGWNLLFFDISTGGTAGGTGWDISKLSRYPAELGVTTGNAAQTYTGIIFDSCYFSYYKPQELGVIGAEFTLFNNSTKENVLVTAANTRHDGPLALAAATTNAYSGGASGTARGRVSRTTMESTGDGQITFDNDSTFSGAITTAQELRMSTYARGIISGNLNQLIDTIPVQVYEVTAVGGATIDVSDPGNQSANLLNTNTVDVFRVLQTNGKKVCVLRTSQALTANATHLSGTTTLTLTTTGIAVGDIVVKRHITSVQHSMVLEGVAENFTSSTILASPDGVQLIDDGVPYFNPESIFGHYALGSFNQTDATRNRFPAGSAGPNAVLSVAGVNNTGASFQRGRFALEGAPVHTTHVFLPLVYASAIDIGVNKAQFSMWFYYDGVNGSTRRAILTQYETGVGFYCFIAQGNSNIVLYVGGAEETLYTGLTTGWHHIAIIINDTNNSYLYLDGVRSVNHSQTSHPGTSTDLGILSGYTAGLTYPGAGMLAADLVIWKDGATLTPAQIRTIYNGGSFLPIGNAFRQRYMYNSTGVAGQRISSKVSMARSTVALTPVIWKAGTIVI